MPAMTGNCQQGIAPRQAFDVLSQQAEDGTSYWSLIIGGEALHIVIDNGGFVAVALDGQRVAAAATLEETISRAVQARLAP